MTMVGGLFDDNDDVDGRETVTKLADSQCKQVQRVTTKLQDKIPPTTLYRWSKRVVRWLEAVHQFCDNDLQVIPAKWLLWKRLKSGKGQLSDRQTQKVWRWMRNLIYGQLRTDWSLFHAMVYRVFFSTAPLLKVLAGFMKINMSCDTIGAGQGGGVKNHPAWVKCPGHTYWLLPYIIWTI